MVGFIFGSKDKDKPWSYEELQRKREIAESLMASNLRTPQNVGEGLASIGRALMYRKLDKKAGAEEKRMREEFERKWGAVLGGYGGGTVTSGGMAANSGGGSFTPSGPALPPPDPNSPHALGDDAMAALGKAPIKTAADPASIKAGLVARGMPEHIADGFIMNFDDESNFDPGINEIAPLVPGSRGGFGLSQWTGPRRRALEAFAAERGVPVDDVDLQLDFLMSELQGPEKAAWEKISGAQNAGEAGAAIVNHFLRPAEEHRASREAEYLGMGGAPVTPQSGGMDIGSLVGLASDPMASPAQKAIVETLIQQQLQAADPMRQLEMERAQLELEALRNPTSKQPESLVERTALLNAAGIDPQSPEGQNYILTGKLPEQAGGNVPAGFASLDMQAQAAGFAPGTPEYQEFMRNGGGSGTPAAFTALDLQARAAGFEPGTPEYQEFMATRGAGLAAQAKAEGEAAAEAVTGLGGALAKGEQALALIDQIAEDPSLPSILGIVQGNIPAGTPVVGGGQAGADLNAKIEQLQGQVFLEAFESLKGGGAITEIEGQKAERAKARLQRTQSPEAYRAALAELREVIESGMRRARDRASNASGNMPGGGANALGLSEEDLKYLEQP